MRSLFSLLSFLSLFYVRAQVQMADGFRGEGKIYVVIAVILVLLAGFFFLLFKLDKRTKRLEEELNDKLK